MTIRRPTGDGPLLTLPALLDTAADFTVIPWRVVDELRLLQHDEVEVVVQRPDHVGERRQRQILFERLNDHGGAIDFQVLQILSLGNRPNGANHAD